MTEERIDFLDSNKNDSELKKIIDKNGWSLSLHEAKEAQKRAKKVLNITELGILDSLWSEHCSYKHTKKTLKMLIKDNSYVLKTKSSEAGAVMIPGTDYVAVFKVESHNHPTQENPFDGAATGIGGVLRDIFAMGARIVGCGVSLRTGPLSDEHSGYILEEGTKGAANYCNVMGVPLIDLDTYFNEYFKENCLANVSAIGVVRTDALMPNTASKDSVGYNLIYFGKETKGAAAGGASSASKTREEGKQLYEAEFGSKPELERDTLIALEQAKENLRKEGLYKKISMKDMGAAGLTCSTSEQVPEGYGVVIYTDKVPSSEVISAYELAVGEDQERNMIIAPKGKATDIILETFKNNEDFIKSGGKITVVGEVISEDRFIMKDSSSGEIYCDIPNSLITNSPQYEPDTKAIAIEEENDFSVNEPEDLKETILNILSSDNVYHKKDSYNAYIDKDFMTVKAGETDTAVIAPLMHEEVNDTQKRIGIALVFGGKSIHGRNGTPCEQAYLATLQARLKLALAGLSPIAATDGCNYANPDKPEDFYSFVEGIKGLNKACKISIFGKNEPLAVVSGNVSLNNTFMAEGKEVKAIDPSMIPGVFGYIEDYNKTVTNAFKGSNRAIYLIGKIKHEFKGSEYAIMNGQLGRNLPNLSEDEAAGFEHASIEAAEGGLIESSKLIGNGGLAAAI
ncbi:MAG: AIR synthase related protein, partial [Actinomycetota bacterium]|nr:AIR synthase related protein [Actinomycetota bacterium]